MAKRGSKSRLIWNLGAMFGNYQLAQQSPAKIISEIGSFKFVFFSTPVTFDALCVRREVAYLRNVLGGQMIGMAYFCLSHIWCKSLPNFENKSMKIRPLPKKRPETFAGSSVNQPYCQILLRFGM